MTLSLVQFFGGIVLLGLGAEYFVRGSAALARKLGVSSLLIGLTVVSFGTSAPELLVSIKSAVSGYPGIALGNVVGSNILNIALVLGLCSLIIPLTANRQVTQRDLPLMIAISLVAVIFLRDKELSRVEGIVLLALMTAYLSYIILLALKKPTEVSLAEPLEHKPLKPLLLPVFITLGLGALLLGSNFLVNGGAAMARQFGISEKVIGISIVAFGTSLPELAATLETALKKEGDLAVGNIVGSNIFNLGLVLGCAGTISPFMVTDLKRLDTVSMLFLSIILFPFLKTGNRLGRKEGIFFFACYLGYTWLLWRGV